MTYAFILGREPALSIAEILTKLKAAGIGHDPKAATYSTAVMLIETDQTLDAEFFHALGGSIKMAEVVRQTKNPDSDLFEILAGLGKESVDFGVSIYDAGAGASKVRPLEAWARKALPLELKKKLKEAGLSARAVLPTDGAALTSVQVDKNRLIEKGGEFLVLAATDGIRLARTIAVQAFESFSERDFGRPKSDAASGMLPPKLARMMVNLAGIGIEEALLDPFCGSGTVLTEAASIGHHSLIASDISEKAVSDTRANVAWVLERLKRPTNAAKIFCADVKDLADHLKPSSVAAIVSEPYLGPPLRGGESDQKKHHVFLELMGLYRRAFAAFAQVLKPGAAVIFVFPVIDTKHVNLLRDLEAIGFKAEALLPGKAAEALNLKSPVGLLYRRPDQLVGRDVFRFRFKGETS